MRDRLTATRFSTRGRSGKPAERLCGASDGRASKALAPPRSPWRALDLLQAAARPQLLQDRASLRHVVVLSSSLLLLATMRLTKLPLLHLAKRVSSASLPRDGLVPRAVIAFAANASVPMLNFASINARSSTCPAQVPMTARPSCQERRLLQLSSRHILQGTTPSCLRNGPSVTRTHAGACAPAAAASACRAAPRSASRAPRSSSGWAPPRVPPPPASRIWRLRWASRWASRGKYWPRR